MMIDLDDSLICKLYIEDNMNMESIAKLMQCSPSTIKRRLIKNKVSLRSKEENTNFIKKEINIPLIVYLYNKGMSISNIANEANLSASTIKRKLSDVGINFRSKEESHRNRTNKELLNKKWLIEQYIDRDKSIRQIASELKNATDSKVFYWINYHGIKKINNRKELNIQDIINKRKKGYTLQELSKETGHSSSAISRAIKNDPILDRKNSSCLPKEIYNKEFLYSEYVIHKKPYALIARELGVSSSTVKNHLVKNNIDIRKNSIKDAFDMGYLKMRSGSENPMFGKDARHGEGQWMYFNDEWYYMRSSWEVLVAQYLISNGYKFKYEEVRFNLGDATYRPDFFIYDDDSNLVGIIEVKGWLHDRHARKAMLFQTLYPEIPYFIWDKEVIREIKKGVA